jgi:hypothetical protein
MDMIPLRSLARKAVAQRSNNYLISTTSLAAVRASGIHTSEIHASVNTENPTSFFIVGTPFNSRDCKGTDRNTDDAGGLTESPMIIRRRLQRVKPAAST